jgi:hypothetical protein
MAPTNNLPPMKEALSRFKAAVALTVCVEKCSISDITMMSVSPSPAKAWWTLCIAQASSSDHLGESGVRGPQITTQSRAATDNSIREPAPAVKTMRTHNFPRARCEEDVKEAVVSKS